VLPHGVPEEHILSESTQWHPLLQRMLLQGDHRNRLAIDVPWRFTHVKLHIDPDGGVARLRVHGFVVPEPVDVAGPGNAALSPQVDLAAIEHGGQVIAASDMYFGGRHHLTLPGASRGMHDGWETRRRRGPGHDWVIVRLAARGTIERVIVDTSHFKGNAPGTCTLEVADAPGLAELSPEAYRWRPLLASSPLTPHTVHEFGPDVLASAGPATHAILRIYPDGGVARLRLFGRVDPAGRRALALARLDALVPEEAASALHACLGAAAFARMVGDGRPYGSEAAFAEACEKAMAALSESDWREAFAAHPRIGATHGASAWARDEQKGTSSASSATRAALERGNRDYEAKFGWIFLICATGRSAEEMLAALEARMQNDAAAEFKVAIEEQKKITRLRLEKLLTT
jgi:allantoicase